jgi:hypothetical protein
MLLCTLLVSSSVSATRANEDNLALLKRLNRLEAEVQALKAQLGKKKTEPAAVKALVVEKHDAPVAIPPPLDRFAGGYAALFGSFTQGIGTDESDALAASFGMDWSKLDSVEIGLATGYNVNSGPLVFGFELAGREPVSGQKRGTNFNGDQPPYVFPRLYLGSYSPLTLATYTIDQLKIGAGPSGEFVSRIGYEIGDLFFYSRLGAGGTFFYQIRNTGNYSSICNQPSVIYGGRVNYRYVYDTITGCGSITTTTSSYTSSNSTTGIPYAVLGFGVEANYDRYFARLEANGSYYINTANKFGIDKAMTQYNGRFGVGVRF